MGVIDSVVKNMYSHAENRTFDSSVIQPVQSSMLTGISRLQQALWKSEGTKWNEKGSRDNILGKHIERGSKSKGGWRPAKPDSFPRGKMLIK